MSTIEDVIKVTLYAISAKAAATPEQLAQFNEKLPPVLAMYKANLVDEPMIYEVFTEIMGPDWEPVSDPRSTVQVTQDQPKGLTQ